MPIKNWIQFTGLLILVDFLVALYGNNIQLACLLGLVVAHVSHPLTRVAGEYESHELTIRKILLQNALLERKNAELERRNAELEKKNVRRVSFQSSTSWSEP